MSLLERLQPVLAVFAVLGGIALEVLAFLLSLPGAQTFQVTAAILLHVGSSLFLGAAFALGGRGKSRPSFAAFVFCFCLVLPGLGIVGLLLGIWPAMRRSSVIAKPDFRVLALERRYARGPLFTARFGLGGFRARLLRRHLPATRRLPLLMALGRRSTPVGNRLLRELLHDTNDEIRLAAYAILDRREREMQASLAAIAEEEKRAEKASERADALHRLAALHWEAAYQDLAEGELSRRHLEKALQALEAALDLRSDDASLPLLRGRVLARLGLHSAATQAYSTLGKFHLPGRRIRSYQAELAFLARDFSSVRQHLAALNPKEVGLAMSKVLHFWSGKAV